MLRDDLVADPGNAPPGLLHGGRSLGRRRARARTGSQDDLRIAEVAGRRGRCGGREPRVRRQRRTRHRSWLERKVRCRKPAIGGLAGGGRMLEVDWRFGRNQRSGRDRTAAGNLSRIRFGAGPLAGTSAGPGSTPVGSAGAGDGAGDGLAADLTGGRSGIAGIRSGLGPSKGSALRRGPGGVAPPARPSASPASQMPAC